MSTGSIRSNPGGSVMSVISASPELLCCRHVPAAPAVTLLLALPAATHRRGWAWPPARGAGRVVANERHTHQRRPNSDVQEPHVARVADDERAPRLDVLPHEHAEQLVRRRGVVE